MKTMKKIIPSLIALSIIVPTFAFAQTANNSTLQAQLQTLEQQLSQLQNQANGTTAQNSSASTTYAFTRSLTVGLQGADVSALQQILINDGDLTAITAPSGYFGQATKKALVAYQNANGITPATGYCGSITIAFLNKTSLSAASTTSTNAAPTTTVVTATTTPTDVTEVPTPTVTNSSANTPISSTSVPVGSVQITCGQPSAILTGTRVLVGGCNLTASSIEGVKISNLNVETLSNDSTPTLKNLKIVETGYSNGGKQFGTTQSAVNSGDQYTTFSDSPFTILAGSEVAVSIYADVLSSFSVSTGTYPLAQIVGVSGEGTISNATINSTTTQNDLLSQQATALQAVLAPLKAQIDHWEAQYNSEQQNPGETESGYLAQRAYIASKLAPLINQYDELIGNGPGWITPISSYNANCYQSGNSINCQSYSQ
jgi:peptidoglycan hydrolase-like protein with peptidoglycan-binding domain